MGKTIKIRCATCKKVFTAFQSTERKYCSRKCYSKTREGVYQPQIKKAQVAAWKKIKGSKLTKEHRQKLSEAKKGAKCYLWKGGIEPENRLIRKGIDFRLWREAVFARDNWTCQKCKTRGCELHPHHMQSFADFPELRFAIDNGITLCKDCHWDFHKKNGKHNNTSEQVIEFLKK